MPVTGFGINAHANTDNAQIGILSIQRSHCVRNSIERWVIGTVAAIKEFDLFASARGYNKTFEKRVGRTGGLHGVRDGTAKARQEGSPPSMGLCHIGLKDHRRLALPMCRDNTNPCLYISKGVTFKYGF